MADLKTDLDYALIFKGAPMLFIVLSPDAPFYTILDANAAYLTGTHRSLENIAGKGFFEIYAANSNGGNSRNGDSLKLSFKKAIETKETDQLPLLKYDVPSATGQGGIDEKYWRIKNTPVLNEQREVIYIISQAEEITEFVQAENSRIAGAKHTVEELERKSVLLQENQDRINSILEALLHFTTLDFSEKLQISQRGDELDAIAFGLNALVDELENQMGLLKRFNTELEETNKELDSFSYSVSHDLRTPLRAISGYSQVLLEDYGSMLNADGRKLIDVIIRNAAKMGTLIDDLLTFSRVGKQNLTKVMLDMNSMVDSVVHDLAHLQKNANTQLVIEPLETINGDSSMLKLVIANLVSNALKYSGKKEKPLITISCYKENNAVIFFVKDNGAGFDMKYYDKLFGVFQRLHSSFDFEGTGVGLALVDRIVKKHGGMVWADAKENEGATFYFSLPVEQADIKTT